MKTITELTQYEAEGNRAVRKSYLELIHEDTENLLKNVKQ